MGLRYAGDDELKPLWINRLLTVISSVVDEFQKLQKFLNQSVLADWGHTDDRRHLHGVVEHDLAGFPGRLLRAFVAQSDMWDKDIFFLQPS